MSIIYEDVFQDFFIILFYIIYVLNENPKYNALKWPGGRYAAATTIKNSINLSEEEMKWI